MPADPAPTALVCGAGRIGRGFVAQLLHRSGWRVHFLDGDAELVATLQRRGSYPIEIAGNPAGCEVVPVAGAHHLERPDDLQAVLDDCPLIASAVGAPNIDALVDGLRPFLERRAQRRVLDWLICENADAPARRMRERLRARAEGAFAEWVERHLGLVETQVLRSGMTVDAETAERDPLALRMHDWWRLPCDRDAFVGPIPAIEGLDPISPFAHELTRKLYTFNGLNGPIAYVGLANGHRLLHEAARAPELQDLWRAIQAESAHGLVHAFGIDPADQAAFQRLAWDKYRDPALADSLARNARDSARKLGPRERLVGPARLCLEHGREPRAYATAIAAAIRYPGEADDPGTARVRRTLERGGIDAVLAEICGLEPDDELARLVRSAERERRYRFSQEVA